MHRPWWAPVVADYFLARHDVSEEGFPEFARLLLARTPPHAIDAETQPTGRQRLAALQF